jgi:hypothetical protein
MVVLEVLLKIEGEWEPGSPIYRIGEKIARLGCLDGSPSGGKLGLQYDDDRGCCDPSTMGKALRRWD